VELLNCSTHIPILTSSILKSCNESLTIFSCTNYKLIGKVVVKEMLTESGAEREREHPSTEGGIR
jgi:hypothetical protein